MCLICNPSGLAAVVAMIAMSAAGRTILHTGQKSDFRIEGDGYFLVRGENPSEFRLTRYAALQLTQYGLLKTASGEWVVGFHMDDHALRVFQFGSAGPTDGPLGIVAFAINSAGTITLNHLNGEITTGGQIPIWLPQDPKLLKRVGEAEFVDPTMTGDWESRLVKPGTQGAGFIQAGEIELPDPALEITHFDRERDQFKVGQIIRTVIQTHLALEGPQFFRVRDPVSNKFFLTRCGAFKLDWDGWLVTLESGFRLQGWTNIAATYPDVASGGSGDVRLIIGTAPTDAGSSASNGSEICFYSIDSNGVVSVVQYDGIQYLHSQIRTFDVDLPENLGQVGTHIYRDPQSDRGTGLLNDPSFPTIAVRDAQGKMQSAALDFNQISPDVLQIWRRQVIGLQSALSPVGDTNFLAISGRGFFVVRDPASNQRFYTRIGMFGWSAAGYLETIQGWRVQGVNYGLGPITNILIQPNPVPFQPVDIRLPSDPNGQLIYPARIDATGKIYMQKVVDGSIFGFEVMYAVQAISQIYLASIPDVTELSESFPYHYQAAGLVGYFEPGMDGLGTIRSGALEQVWELGRDIPSSAPVRGQMMKPWGLLGRTAHLQTCSNLTEWTVTNFPAPILRGLDNLRTIEPGKPVVLTEDVTASTCFYRLVMSPSEAGGSVLPGF